MKGLAWLFCLISLLLTACQPIHVSQSPEYFLPPELGAQLNQLQAFPGAWWNYVIVSRPSKEICDVLKSAPGLARVGCSYGSGDLKDLLQPWLHDLPLRSPPPTSDFLLQKMNLALAKATAPVGSELLEVLRSDPLGSYEQLTQLLLSLSPLSLEYRDNFLRFPGSNWAVIPVLFEYGRAETEATAALRGKVEEACQGNCGELYFVGSHFANEWNKRIIQADMARVSLVGTVLLFVFLGALVLTGRWTAILVTIPISIGVAVAGLCVNALNGGIHGLTVAFGSSLTGIAMDYAFHAFVRNSGNRVWHANFIGYLTTITVFVVMAFSGIPLVREIMLFGFIGVTLALGLFYLAIKLLPLHFQIQPFALVPTPLNAAPWLLASSLVIIVGSGLFLRPDFSLQNLEQSSAEEKRVTRELFRSAAALPPIVLVHGENTPEAEFEKEQALAKEKGVRLVNRLTFLPTLAAQEANLSAWRALVCGMKPWEKQFTVTYRRFFAPFFATVSCEAIGQLRPTVESAYARSLRGEGKWLSTFFPANKEQEKEIRAALPGAYSVRDIVNLFPQRMQREIAWMCPLAILIIAGIVWLSYGSWKIALAVFIPWIVGAALSFLGLLVSPSGFGFVSIVGLLMVFGVATDFGVFCANYYINSQVTRQGIWTALLLSSLVSLFGFLPLLFADHVVLRQLGEPLVLGTIGTLLGTFFVQPWWMRYALAK